MGNLMKKPLRIVLDGPLYFNKTKKEDVDIEAIKNFLTEGAEFLELAELAVFSEEYDLVSLERVDFTSENLDFKTFVEHLSHAVRAAFVAKESADKALSNYIQVLKALDTSVRLFDLNDELRFAVSRSFVSSSYK